MTDYRALCAELADSVELLLAMRTALHQGQREFKQLAITEGRLDRARVALAEPVSPPEGEVAELVAWLRENAEDERQMCESSALLNAAGQNLSRRWSDESISTPTAEQPDCPCLRYRCRCPGG